MLLREKLRRHISDSSKKDKFARDVMVVLTGSGLSQAIAMGSAPIISRLYSPTEFGLWALVMAVVAIPASIACGRYEMAIHLPDSDEDAFALLVLAFLVSVAVSLVCLVVVALFGLQLSHVFGADMPPALLWIVPPMVLLTATYSAMSYWFKRCGRFKDIAKNSVLTRTLVAAIQVILGWWKAGAAGLVAGGIVGQTATVALLIADVRKKDQHLFPSFRLAALRQQARRYREFPRYLVPSGLVETCSAQLPSLLFSALFGAGVLGLFSMATRMVSMPLSLMGNSVRDVFWQAASREYSQKGNCQKLFIHTSLRLAVLGVLPALVILIMGPVLFGWVFGAEWREAGRYARLLGVMFWLRFVSSPVSSMFYIAEKQRLDLVIQVAVFSILLVTFLAVWGLGFTPAQTVLLYSGIYSVKYLVEFVLSYRFAVNSGACTTPLSVHPESGKGAGA